jgi:site-specific DNA-methyltransferase (adenine-specific)
VIELHNADCLEVMRGMADNSVSAIITDPPYATTEASWDVLPDFKELFKEFRRVLSDKGSIVLTCCMPFAAHLIVDNSDIFKYDAIFLKNRKTDFVNAKNKPMRGHENILVFSKGTTANKSNNLMTYNPQGLIKEDLFKINSRQKKSIIGIRENYNGNEYVQEFSNYPDTIFMSSSNEIGLHPTQKPIDLMARLIRTYTNEGDTILDPFMGSGTTGAACKLLNRSFIGCELDKGYFEIAQNRINSIGAFDDEPILKTVTTTKTTTITKTVTKTKTVELRQADLFV